MSKLLLSMGLLLGSLTGLAGASEPTMSAPPAKTVMAGEHSAVLVYGPYTFTAARVVANDLDLQGYDTEIVLGNNGFYYVYAW